MLTTELLKIEQEKAKKRQTEEAAKSGELGKEFGILGGRPKKGKTPLAKKKGYSKV